MFPSHFPLFSFARRLSLIAHSKRGRIWIQNSTDHIVCIYIYILFVSDAKFRFCQYHFNIDCMFEFSIAIAVFFFDSVWLVCHSAMHAQSTWFSILCLSGLYLYCTKNPRVLFLYFSFCIFLSRFIHLPRRRARVCLSLCVCQIDRLNCWISVYHGIHSIFRYGTYIACTICVCVCLHELYASKIWPFNSFIQFRSHRIYVHIS